MTNKRMLFLCMIVTMGLFCTQAFAVPALSKLISITQKDGTTLTIQKFGDEFFHYTTTSDGYMIVQKNGIYYYSEVVYDGSNRASKVKASDPAKRTNNERIYLNSKSASKVRDFSAISSMRRAQQAAGYSQKAFPTTGKLKGVVILVNFSDVQFSDAASAQGRFTDLLNQQNYTVNGGTGSARDFYMDNSMGKFQPEFNVYGPVTLSKPMAFYGGNNPQGNDANPRQFAIDATQAASTQLGVDFSQYDADNDGNIDMVFFYYAGYNEAEGAPDDTIWPHKWYVNNDPTLYSGKTLYTYACTSEFRGVEGQTMCGIGTFTHEFGHVLGLADTYDTDGSAGGSSSGLFQFDIMTAGNYNNDGCTPPFYPAVHRVQLGWLTPIPLNDAKEFELKSIDQNQAYIIPTITENEYFLLEYRNEESQIARNWDKYIGYDQHSQAKTFSVNGLLITHIDKSTNNAGGLSAAMRWDRNVPNAYMGHECARMVYSGGKTQISSYEIANAVLFPGAKEVTAFSSKTTPAAIDWNENRLFVNLKDIRVDGNVLKFTNDIKLINYKEYTNAIILDWFTQSSTNKVSWKKQSADTFESATIDGEAKYTIQGLQPNQTYLVRIEELIGDKFNVVVEREITTTAIDTTQSPKMIFDFYHDSASAIFNPIITNTASTNMVWYLNGEVTKVDDATKMPYGDYVIKCEMQVDGRKEFVVKFANAR
ncbi:MAG: M6 family metalloprotease domain-containing protein [Alistipes sp.]